MLNNLGQLILDRMDKAEDREEKWLSEHTGFRECLRSCLGADIPYLFTLVHATVLLSTFIASLMIDRKPGPSCCVANNSLFAKVLC